MTADTASQNHYGHLGYRSSPISPSGLECKKGASVERDLTYKATMAKIRFAHVNEGKLSLGKLIALGKWMSVHKVDLTGISEGAWPGKRRPEGFHGPLNQRESGAAFYDANASPLMTGRKVTIHNGTHWDIAILPLRPDIALATAYITPSATVGDRSKLYDCLEKTVLNKFPNCIVQGDLNAPSPSSDGQILHAFLAGRGLKRHTPFGLGTNRTFRNGQVTQSTDIDVIYSRLEPGHNLQLTEVMVRRQNGHSRLICELTLDIPLPLLRHTERIRWANLRDARYASRFRRAVSHRISQGDQLEDAIKKAGKEVLG